MLFNKLINRKFFKNVLLQYLVSLSTKKPYKHLLGSKVTKKSIHFQYVK